jgi:hypothetical protein
MLEQAITASLLEDAAEAEAAAAAIVAAAASPVDAGQDVTAPAAAPPHAPSRRWGLLRGGGFAKGLIWGGGSGAGGAGAAGTAARPPPDSEACLAEAGDTDDAGPLERPEVAVRRSSALGYLFEANHLKDLLPGRRSTSRAKERRRAASVPVQVGRR